MAMNITILTPEREIFSGAIVSLTVPGTSGMFQVLTNHAPIVSSLSSGSVRLVTNGGEYRYFDEGTGTIMTSSKSGETLKFKVDGGFIEVLSNEISLLVRGVKNNI